MADGGSGDADTRNSGPTWAASEANLRDHAVRLRKRRGRYCLRRSCEGYDKASSSNQPDHFLSSLLYRGLFNLVVGGSRAPSRSRAPNRSREIVVGGRQSICKLPVRLPLHGVHRFLSGQPGTA